MGTTPSELSEPPEAWQACRSGTWTSPTAGLCAGYVQTNLAVLPYEDAFDFLRFCQRNPKPCPVLEVLDPGNPEPALIGSGADMRTDLPGYRVYRNGALVEEPTDVRHLWRDDLVSFLLGCSFTFEHELRAEGIPVRHIEQKVNCPVYRTNQPCRPAGKFHGPLVVSMRPIPAHQIAQAVTISAARPDVHGAPVHVGAPDALGIADLAVPDWGDPVTLATDDVPVFWACGVTPQAVAERAAPELMITHAPGHMFITRATERTSDSSGGEQR